MNTPDIAAILDKLEAVARAALHAADDSEEQEGEDGRCHVVSSADFDALSAALDALEELPQPPDPGYVYSGPGAAMFHLRAHIRAQEAELSGADEMLKGVTAACEGAEREVIELRTERTAAVTELRRMIRTYCVDDQAWQPEEQADAITKTALLRSVRAERNAQALLDELTAHPPGSIPDWIENLKGADPTQDAIIAHFERAISDNARRQALDHENKRALDLHNRELRAENTALRAELSALRGQIKALEAERDTLRVRMEMAEDAARKGDDARRNAAAMQERIAELEAKIKRAEEQEPVGEIGWAANMPGGIREAQVDYRLPVGTKLYTAPKPAPAIPKEVLNAIGSMLTQCMETASSNGANSVSMPDEYVWLAAWLEGCLDGIPAPLSVPSKWRVALGACVAALKECGRCMEPSCKATQDEYVEAALLSAETLLAAAPAKQPERCCGETEQAWRKKLENGE